VHGHLARRRKCFRHRFTRD